MPPPISELPKSCWPDHEFTSDEMVQIQKHALVTSIGLHAYSCKKANAVVQGEFEKFIPYLGELNV